MRKGVMIYFVLYIVLITELLVVITERDDLHEEEQQIMNGLAGHVRQTLDQSLRIDIPMEAISQAVDPATGKSRFDITLIPKGLVSEVEQKNIQYFVSIPDGPKPRGWEENFSLNSIDQYSEEAKFKLHKQSDGFGKLEVLLDRNDPRSINFQAYFTVNRNLPSYIDSLPVLKRFVLKGLDPNLSDKYVNNLDETSKEVTFTIRADQIGIGKKIPVDVDN